ncbi:hypothetical protein ACX1HO_22080 [Yersinia enterocolitica]|uniref:hypothetical protein n=1 Tax=Yersinia enterocolitica TaxID=630 RepID=UPI00094BB665|nr:hypothetical protein [Yersinia enterocolitica]EKN4037910.1 hypothetical protein [Yersinia enterocolitica]OWF71643.1 hypothetical protein B4907_22795 [Yersinia kristensenii]
MNKISMPTVHLTTLSESSEFNEIISKMDQEEKLSSVIIKENFDGSANDNTALDVIIGYMVVNNTIELMKKHQDFIKEIMDEE